MALIPISPPPREPITQDAVSSNWEMWFSLLAKRVSQLVVASASAGTVTSVGLSTTGDGLAISGSPVTAAGTMSVVLDDDAAALEALSGTGGAFRTGSNTWALRVVSSGTGISVVDGSGVAGNPTIALATLADNGAGTFLKITRDGFGRVSGTTPVVAGDITGLLGTTYVVRSGDTMTGALGVVAGSAALPGLFSSGDTNTGIYFSSADTFNIVTGGISRVVVGASGKTTIQDITVGLGNNAVASCTSVGFEALFSNNVTGTNNVAVGYRVLRNNTTGNGNAGVGTEVLFTNTIGNNNVSFGHQALYNNTSGSNNAAFGNQALFQNTTASENVAFGHFALSNATTGSFNVGVGSQALLSNIAGNNNSSLGYLSLVSNLSGNDNVALGYLSMALNETGSGNTAVGWQAGHSDTVTMTGATNCTYLGYGSRADADLYTNSTAIGSNSIITASNQVVLGSSSVTSTITYGKIGVGIPAPTASMHLRAGTTAVNTAPLKFNSGSLNTTAEVGAVEFLTDKYYAVITTGAARKEIALNDSALTSGRVPFVTTNGRLTDDSDLAFATDTLTATKVKSPNPLQQITTGAAAVAGNATLVAGTVTVNTTAVKTASVVMLTRKTSGGTLGTAITYTISNGVSFTINSDSASDTSTFSWLIVDTY